MSDPAAHFAGQRRMLQRDHASAALGMVVERDEPGESVVSMRVRDDMTNGFAITHGGMVFALADTAFAMACNELDPGAAGAADDVTVSDETGDIVAEFRGRSLTTRRSHPDDAG
jgi:acyl-CoA thioesterase